MKDTLRPIARKAYNIPILGYLARWMVAFVRLPRSEAYQAHQLEELRSKSPIIESQIESLLKARHEQAHLLAELTRLLEEGRESLARTAIDLERKIGHLQSQYATWIPEALNRIKVLEAAIRTRERRSTEREEALMQRLPAWPPFQSPAPLVDGRDDVVGAFEDFSDNLSYLVRQLQDDLSQWGRELERAREYLTERVEFIRREAMFEIRYREDRGISSSNETHIKILNPEKMEKMPEEGYRVNIGCAHIPLDDYINVDFRDLPSVDILADASDMPFEPETLAELTSSHLLEHFPQEQLRRKILPYWRSLLKAGGLLRAVVPDAKAMMEGWCQGAVSYEDLREVTFGGQDYEGNFHYNMFTPDSLKNLLEEARFVDIECPVRGRRNGRCLEFEIRAFKPKHSDRE